MIVASFKAIDHEFTTGRSYVPWGGIILGNIASTSWNWLKLGMDMHIPTQMTHAKYQDVWSVGGGAKQCESSGQAGNIAPTDWNTMKLCKHVSMHVRMSCTRFH
jgi:hypothetical protein